jgi:hypothetical protein
MKVKLFESDIRRIIADHFDCPAVKTESVSMYTDEESGEIECFVDAEGLIVRLSEVF